MIERMRLGCQRLRARGIDLAHRTAAFVQRVPMPRYMAQKAASEELHASTAQFEALTTLAQPSDAQRIGIMQMEEGYQLQLDTLLAKPSMTFIERGQVQHLQRTLADLKMQRAGATPETVGNKPLSLFGPVGAAMGAASGWQLWAAGGAAVLLLFGAYKLQVDGLQHHVDRLTHDRDAPCTERELTGETTRQACVSLAQEEMAANAYRQALEDAKQNVVATAQTLTRLEQQRQAAAAAQRRNQHDVESVLSGIGDPPDFGLRTRADSAGHPAAAPAAPADRPR